MPKTDKSSIEIFNNRVESVYKLLCRSKKIREIKAYAKKEGWNVTDRQIENYINKARELIKQDAGFDGRKEVSDKCKLGMWQLYDNALSDKDNGLAFKVLDRINVMFGEEANQKQEQITVNIVLGDG